jgi:hypothetical protein
MQKAGKVFPVRCNLSPIVMPIDCAELMFFVAAENFAVECVFQQRQVRDRGSQGAALKI